METLDLQKLWEQYHMADLQGKIEELFPQYDFHLEDMLRQILSGDVLGALSDGLGRVIHAMTTEAAGIRNVLLYLLVLGIVSALLSHFTEVFDSHQVADISFCLVYLLLTGVLLKAFGEVAGTAEEALQNIVLFIRIFLPTYFLAVGAAGNVVTAYTGYQILLFLIYGVERLLLSGILPFIYSYVLLAMVHGVWAEERLNVLLEFFQKCINGLLKAAIGVVTGISLFHSMITPVLDSVKASAVQKAVSAIPGMGNVADGVVEMMVGSAVLIKNSIGAVFVILLLALCLVPLLKIFLIAICLKAGAALMGIISDKRITDCTQKVGEGSFLLFRTVGTALFLFLILIAVASYTTNRSF